MFEHQLVILRNAGRPFERFDSGHSHTLVNLQRDGWEIVAMTTLHNGSLCIALKRLAREGNPSEPHAFGMYL